MRPRLHYRPAYDPISQNTKVNRNIRRIVCFNGIGYRKTILKTGICLVVLFKSYKRFFEPIQWFEKVADLCLAE